MGGEPRAMRVGKSAESSTIELTEEDFVVAVRPLGRVGEPLVGVSENVPVQVPLICLPLMVTVHGVLFIG